MMKGQIGNLMKQAQKMQEDMKKAQEDMKKLEVTGQSGAGLVKVTMTGKHDVKRIDIDDSLLKEDKEILEDLIAAAVNDAVREVEKNTKETMGDITSGIPLPPGMKLPF